MCKPLLAGAFLHFAFGILHFSPAQGQQLRVFDPVSFEKVKVTDNFWRPKMEKVSTRTLEACIYQTETATPRIRNFEKAALRQGKHEGIYYDDSDVYKALEAISYSLRTRPDAALEKKADEWIDKIVAAQQPDGYLNTYYTLMNPAGRWTDMEKHEDYCAGHLIEAAIAYYHSTGKRKLLDAAIRFADHIDSTFRLGNRNWVTGHQEIELALMKLYHVTKNQRYVQLAEWLLDQRGRGYGRGVIWDQWKDPKYCQDSVPVKQQKEITGHAVRAMYLYTGAADVAAVTGDSGYLKAMRTVWEDVVHRNMYVTGGIGSSGRNEGFSFDFDLPNETAYCETCASVGMVFWNQRMNLLTGESKYIDVLERSLYNGALSGLSESGDRFFYGNPLASRGQHNRREWFGTACCPSNIARLVASVGGYIYGKSADGVWVNLFVNSSTTIPFGKEHMTLTTQTDFPWNGAVLLRIDPSKQVNKTLFIRIPGWARNEAVDGGLYRFSDTIAENIEIRINGRSQPYTIAQNGYLAIKRNWKKGDVVEFDLGMKERWLTARDDLQQNQGRKAIQRGPLVYCIEGRDNNDRAWNVIARPSASFTAIPMQIGSERVTALRTQMTVIVPSPDNLGVSNETRTIVAIPYYAWANRGNGEMQVWLPVSVKDVKINY